MAKGIAVCFALITVGLGAWAFVHLLNREQEPPAPVGVAETQSPSTAGQPVASQPPAAESTPNTPDSAQSKAVTTAESHGTPAPAGTANAKPALTNTGKPVGSPIRERPLFDGWKDPRLVLILSGEQHGYVEPCGCSVNQLGGLSRRADLIRQLNERGWTTTGFDVGGLVNNPNRKQGKLKFEMMVKCLTDMRYAGVANGVEELQLTFDFLSYHRPEELPFLAANLVLFDDPAFTGAPLLKRVLTVGQVKLGVLGIFGPELDDKVRPNGQPLGDFEFRILPPADVIQAQLAELQAEQPDLLILLSHSRLDASRELAEKFPVFDIVVTSGGTEDPDPRPRYVGDKTLFVAPGQKGKRVPVVGFFAAENREERLRYELVDLDDKRFRESPQIAAHMRYYQDEMLKERNLVANEPAIDDPRNFHPRTGAPVDAAENPFVGSKACGECHTSAYEVWKDSNHGKSTETLKTGRDHRPDYISRLYDPECIACHVTGWDPKKVVRYTTGYTGNENPPDLLTGQGCENCHGPGGKHAELERLFAKQEAPQAEVEAWRKFHRLSVKTSYDLCAKCHDGDNDPQFNSENFERYWNEIAHPGKD